jgi:hypothetical protein
MALTLEQINAAIATAERAINEAAYSGDSSGMGSPIVTRDMFRQLDRLRKAKRIAELRKTAEDSKRPQEERTAATSELDTIRSEVASDVPSFLKEQEKLYNDVATLSGQQVTFDAADTTIESVIGKKAPTETPKAEAATKTETPAATEVAGPPAPAPPAPTKPAPIPTKTDVSGLEGDIEAMKSPIKRLREIELERDEMRLNEERAAQRQRAYDALSPAQKLELDVRSREQQKAANAKAAVSERRDQIAADEEYKGMQIASSGSFKQGDVTQYVDPNERAAAQSYFTNRAADIRAGEDPEVRAKGGQFTAGPAPTFSGDRSLAVMDIDPRYGGGKATGKNPNFAGGAKFGPDPNTMASEMIGGAPTPIMTVGQAYSTQSRGPGINQYEKTGTIPQQLDARSARGIRDAARKQQIEEEIEYALTGKLPPRLEEERRKRLQEEQRSKENAAINTGPANPKSQYA